MNTQTIISCACGSGEDARQCCLPYANVYGLTLMRYRTAYHKLQHQLNRFLESPGQRTRLMDALQHYYSLDDDIELVTDDLLCEAEEKARFFPWLAWDYRHPISGRTLGEDFVSLVMRTNSSVERELAQKLIESHSSFFQVLEVEPRIGAWLEDYDQSQRHFVHDELLAMEVVSGDIVLARLVGCDQYRLIDSVYAYLPGHYRSVIDRYVTVLAAGQPEKFKQNLPETLTFIANLQDLLDDTLILDSSPIPAFNTDQFFRLTDPDF